MKINCPCGNTISTSSEDLTFEAKLMAGEDADQMFEALEVLLPKQDFDHNDFCDLFLDYTRTIYQCYECSRLLFFNKDQKLLSFLPEKPEESFEVLRSTKK